MTNGNTLIRTATPEDEAGWRVLWAGYLAFYDCTLAPEVTARTWARLMDPGHPMTARLAFDNGQMLGFAIHHAHASTWVLGDDCYLEDLFISESARGKGLGRALLDDLIALAKQNGWHRLYWHTNEGNTRARALYDQYVASDGHIRYRMPL